MPDFFEQIIGQVLKNEGGWVDDLDDPGGETNFGISKRQYPHLDIKNLTVDQAKGIYRTDYYNLMNVQALASLGIQYYVLDMGVNSGIRQGTELVQRALHLTEDGNLGPLTAAAANACDEHGLQDRLIEIRMLHFVSCVLARPKEVKFLRNWTMRAFITL